MQKSTNTQVGCISIWMLIIVLPFAAVINGAKLNCLQCADFNKEQQSTVVCPTSPKQCGDCYRGFQSVSWDKYSCHPIDIEILQQPKNASGAIGNSLILNCTFNLEDVQCEWDHGGRSINGQGGRYRLWGGQNCALEINGLQKDDAGSWRCHGFTDFVRDGVSSIAWITINNNVIVLEHPQHAIVQYKQKVVLRCKFNVPVICEWLHKGRNVEYRKGYRLLNQGDYNGRRNDCSIEISSFKKKDAGMWQCRNAPDGVFTVSSNKAFLFNGPPKKGQCHQMGQKIILNCFFGKPTPCTWIRNKKPVKIESRYKYVLSGNERSRTDCSILINKFTNMDIGQWACEKLANDHDDGSFRNITELCPAGPKSKNSKGNGKPKRSITEIMMPLISPIVIEHPVTASHNFGDTVLLPCKLSMEISDCFWLRNEHMVVIEHRYRYVHELSNGHNTTDCSLEVELFQETDVGTWVCGSVADDSSEGAVSDPGYLYIERSDNFEFEYPEEFYDFESESEYLDLGNATEDFPYLGMVALAECIVIAILALTILLLWILKSKKLQEYNQKADSNECCQNSDGSASNLNGLRISSTTHLISDTEKL